MKGAEFFTQLASRPPFSKAHPALAAFMREYLSDEKAVNWKGRRVINTNFPPCPSRAFEEMAEIFTGNGERRLYSVTLAVTNRCGYDCWHCYNAGRCQTDAPLAAWKNLAGSLQNLGAVMVTLTGGEPLLRDDLEEICRAFDSRSCLIVGTTGCGLTPLRARRLKKSGVFGMGISLDSQEEPEHDRLRGKAGAFRAALAALAMAREAGIYPYVVSVASRESLRRERFMAFLEFAKRAGAMEVHLLEPSATGRLAGRRDVLLDAAHRALILDYQHEVAAREDLPVLSTFTYLESAAAFGCGAGRTHIYVDGSGELCPCNLVPVSFGNIVREPFETILERMGHWFKRPRPSCVGRCLARHIPPGSLPTPPKITERLCRKHLPRTHALPRFFRLRSEMMKDAGAAELRKAYNRVHADYDDFWLAQAGRPVRDLVRRLKLRGGERVFEAGCGSGYGTALLASGLKRGGTLLAADISEGMLGQARQRLQGMGAAPVEFKVGDALELLKSQEGLDLIFTTWVLGYIPLRPFFEASSRAMATGGRLAFIVHRDNSPREQMDIFADLVARDPSALTRKVSFDFPRDADHAREEARRAGLEPVELWEGRVTFRYPTPQAVLEHLLKSGAGTVFHDAIAPARRKELESRFLAAQRALRRRDGTFAVVHRYIGCVAMKNGTKD